MVTSILKKTIKQALKIVLVPRYKYLRTINTKDTPKITLSMIVKNEEGRFLEQVLSDCVHYIDNAVIIDDGSTDRTVEICKRVLKNIPHTIIINTQSKFQTEYILRKQQWEETIKTEPDWILSLDADEIFEDEFKYSVKELISNVNADAIYFRLYDMWNEFEYRSDYLWNAHEKFTPFLIRYRKDVHYFFKKTNQHCGRLPMNIHYFPNVQSRYRIKHLGWCRESDRIRKYERYMTLDSNGRNGNLEHYHSILDPNPNLCRFEE